MSRHFRTFDPATGNDSLLPESSLPGGGNVSDGDELFSGLTLPASGFKVADVSGNHTLTLGVSGNCTGNHSVSYLDPGGNVTIDLSAHAGLTYRPPVTLAIDGNVTSSSTTAVDVTGFACDIAAYESVIIELMGFTVTSASTTGVGFALTGPSSPAAVQIGGFNISGATTVRSEPNVDAFATDWVLASSSGTNAHPIYVYIKVCNGSNAGTLQIKFRSEISASATWVHPVMRITRPEII